MKNYDELFVKIVFAFENKKDETLTTGELVKACYPNALPKNAAQVCNVLANMRIEKYIKRVKRGVYQLTTKGKDCLK